MQYRSNAVFSLLIVIAVALWGFSERRNAYAEAIAPITFITTEIVQTERTFQYTLYDFTFRVFSTNPDGSNRQELFTHTVKRCQSCSIYTAEPIPNSNRMVLIAALSAEVSFRTHVDVYILDLDAKTLTQVDADVYGLSNLTVSPDGTRLAYLRLSAQSTPDNQINDTVILDWQTQQIVQTVVNPTPQTAVYGVIQWDPQDEWLLFQTSTANQPTTENDEFRLTFCVNRVKIGNADVLPLIQHGIRPRWSPDGSHIAYCGDDTLTARQRNPFRHVLIADREGKNLRQMTEERIDCVALLWSPQADRLLYSDGRNLFTIEVATGETRKVYGSGIPVYQVIWSPDGNYLAFIRDSALEVLSLEDGTSQRLTEGETVTVLSW